jgi:hypothetical protein
MPRACRSAATPLEPQRATVQLQLIRAADVQAGFNYALHARVLVRMRRASHACLIVMS